MSEATETGEACADCAEETRALRRRTNASGVAALCDKHWNEMVAMESWGVYVNLSEPAGDLEIVRAHVEAIAERGSGVDPQVVLRLLDALEAAEWELLPSRAFLADVDAFFDGAEGDLFTAGHNCLCQRRVADFREHWWKPSANERGYQRVRKTWGRGR